MNPDVLASLIVNAPLLPQGFITIKNRFESFTYYLIMPSFNAEIPMRKTVIPAIAIAVFITGLKGETKQPVPVSSAGSFEIGLSKAAGNPGSFIRSKVLFSRPGEKGDAFHHSRKALLVKDRYIVILDNSATAGIDWKNKAESLPIFLTHPEGKTLKEKGKSLRQLVLAKDGDNSPENIAIITMTPGIKVNGVQGKPGLNLASGINHQMAVVQKARDTDRIFWGRNGKPAVLGNTHWAVNAHTAIIREIGNETTQLAALGNTGKSRNLIATRFVSLEIEGENVAIEGTLSSPLKDPLRNAEVTEINGHYLAKQGATLRLRFGAPTQTIMQQDNRLLAFWKFDEGTGATVNDLKAPGGKSRLIGIDPKQAWTKGVGFGKTGAVLLRDGAHIQTPYTKSLQGNNSIALWVKTKAGGLLVSKVAENGENLLPGSRMIEVTPTGEIKLTLLNTREEMIRSTVKVNDDKWHHVAWTVTEQPDEGMRVALGAEHRLYIDAKLQGHIKVNRPYGAESVRNPLTIGKAISYQQGNGQPVKIAGFKGSVDNLRIYNFPLNGEQIGAFNMVGRKTSPFVITSNPKKTVRVGERFEYSIKFTGVPTANFKFNTLPEWMKFEGLLTGIPTAKDLGLSKPISIVGMSPLGPGQQIFSINVLPPLVSKEWEIKVNGNPVPTRYTGLGIEADLPPGSGNWNFTRKTRQGGK